MSHPSALLRENKARKRTMYKFSRCSFVFPSRLPSAAATAHSDKLPAHPVMTNGLMQTTKPFRTERFMVAPATRARGREREGSAPPPLARGYHGAQRRVHAPRCPSPSP